MRRRGVKWTRIEQQVLISDCCLGVDSFSNVSSGGEREEEEENLRRSRRHSCVYEWCFVISCPCHLEKGGGGAGEERNSLSAITCLISSATP